jgi:phosphoglycolate phosphatase-like HAD superfamily hydrolase
MGLKPSACIYVGDSPHDLEMATRAGVRSIAIIGCFPTEKSLRAANPEVLLESLSQLPDALKRLQNLKINRQS